jgi:CRISPR-associated endoribonuclease Cas6
LKEKEEEKERTMPNTHLYSVVFELFPRERDTVSLTTGHQTHALFLDLIRQIDPLLATRLHEEPAYRPFTISPLKGGQQQGGRMVLQAGQYCRFRATLLDGEGLWHSLKAYSLKGKLPVCRVGETALQVHRIITTPQDDTTEWAGYTTWDNLSSTVAQKSITLRFASPTAFSLGKRQFVLLPDPVLVWDSLVRVWNKYAPDQLKLDRAEIRAFVKSHVIVNDSRTQTTVLYFPTHPQRGFIGTCSYHIQPGEYTSQLAALADFARYAGVGSKTTMGMGQVRAERIVKK